MNFISKCIKKLLTDSRPEGQIIKYKFQPGEMQRILAEHLINTEQILNTEDYIVNQFQLILPTNELEFHIKRKKSPPPPPPPVIVAPPLSTDTSKDDKNTNINVNNPSSGAGKEDIPRRA